MNREPQESGAHNCACEVCAECVAERQRLIDLIRRAVESGERSEGDVIRAVCKVKRAHLN